MFLLHRFIASQNSTMDDAYFAALAADADLGRTRGIDATLQKFNLDAILLPTNGFVSGPAAIAGYPVITGSHQHLLPLTRSSTYVRLAFVISSVGIPTRQRRRHAPESYHL